MPNEVLYKTPEEQEQLFNKFWEDDSLTPATLTAQPNPAPSSEVVPKPEESATPVATEEVAAKPEDKSPEAVATTTPPENSPQTPAPTTDPIGELLNKVPEELKPQLETLLVQAKEAQIWQQHHQNLASKHRKLHNELNRLKGQVEQAQQKPQPAQPASTATEIDEVETQLQEADPVLAKYLNTKLAKLEAKLAQEAQAKAQEAIQPYEQQQHEHFVNEQRNILTQAVPNWQEVATSEMFNAWLEHQTPSVKGLYNSYAADNIRLLQLYQNDMELWFGNQQSQPKQAPAQPAPNPVATKVVENRQKKLETSAPLPNSHVGVTKPAERTPKQLFDDLYNNPDLIMSILGKSPNN